MPRYASTTEVSVERTQAELQRLVERYGATAYLAGKQGDRVVVAFEMESRRVRFSIMLPSPYEDRFIWTDEGYKIAASRSRALHEQEVRSLQTAGEWLAPQIAESYRNQTMPPLLPGAGGEQRLIEEG